MDNQCLQSRTGTVMNAPPYQHEQFLAIYLVHAINREPLQEVTGPGKSWSSEHRPCCAVWASCKRFSWLWVKPEPYADDPYIKSGMMTDRKYMYLLRLARVRQRRARHRLPIFLAVREMHRSTCGCQAIRSSIKTPRYFALVVYGRASFRQPTTTSGCCPRLLVKTNTLLFFAF